MTDQKYDTAAERLQAEGEAVRNAAEDARESNATEPETEEEYYERIRLARSTGIFGDTPTDPTSGDVQVPSTDENAPAVSQVDAAAEEGNEEAQEESPEQAKRQPQGLSEESLEKADAQSNDEDENAESNE